jgi:hypothetical protein
LSCGLAIYPKRVKTRKAKYLNFRAITESNLSAPHIAEKYWMDEPKLGRWPLELSNPDRTVRLLTKKEGFNKAQEGLIHYHHGKSCPEKRTKKFIAKREEMRGTKEAREHARLWLKKNGFEGTFWAETLYPEYDDLEYEAVDDQDTNSSDDDMDVPDTVLRVDVLIDEALNAKTVQMHRELEKTDWVVIEDPLESDWSEAGQLEFLDLSSSTLSNAE